MPYSIGMNNAAQTSATEPTLTTFEGRVWDEVAATDCPTCLEDLAAHMATLGYDGETVYDAVDMMVREGDMTRLGNLVWVD